MVLLYLTVHIYLTLSLFMHHSLLFKAYFLYVLFLIVFCVMYNWLCMIPDFLWVIPDCLFVISIFLCYAYLNSYLNINISCLSLSSYLTVYLYIIISLLIIISCHCISPFYISDLGLNKLIAYMPLLRTSIHGQQILNLSYFPNPGFNLSMLFVAWNKQVHTG